jgi:hypothetical protein
MRGDTSGAKEIRSERSLAAWKFMDFIVARSPGPLR